MEQSPDFEPESPDFRATVRRDRTVQIVDWGPWLAVSGPLYTMLDARGRAGVAIADLTVVRDEDGIAVELIVDFHCRASSLHREALCAWAERVGYRRAWLSGEVAELDPVPGGAAQTRCSCCRLRMVDAGAPFWEFVRRRGAFPTACVLCGADLPQWTPVRDRQEPVSNGDVRQATRRTGCS